MDRVNWNSVCNSADANVSYSQFIQKFNELYDKCIPRIKKRVYPKRSKPKSPWISFALLKSINRKNKLYKRSIKKPTDTNIESYKKYRNKLNTLLRLAKRNYYCDLLDQEKNNIKNTWKVLNSIIRTKTKHCTEKFVSDNVTYTCPIKIATEFFLHTS